LNFGASDLPAQEAVNNSAWSDDYPETGIREASNQVGLALELIIYILAQFPRSRLMENQSGLLYCLANKILCLFKDLQGCKIIEKSVDWHWL
jgi:hypothetical protein